VDGAKAAILAVSPILSESDPQLLSQIQQRFTEVDQSLTPHRAGSGYVLYTKLTDADTKKLSESIDALAQPISEVAPAVLR
jgi:iron uptake system component EfeO